MARSAAYGRKHQLERHKLKPIVESGQASCQEPICLEPDRWIAPGTPWDLAHDREASTLYGVPIYRGPAHQRCNRAEGARWRHLQATHQTNTSTTRKVILICGPPGAGKSTIAQATGLAVYDRDDPQWRNAERAFTLACSALAADPDARAAVIRSGATLSAREAAARRIGATETRVVLTDEATCIRRVIARGRPHPSMPRQVAAVRAWWRAYEPDERGWVL